jgi:methylmalonyl-CoA/ethylmalonyl-CoA epimerase
MFEKCHHIGIAVPDMAKAIAWYEKSLGYKVISGPFDDPLQNVTVCFVSSGEPGAFPLELVAPLGANSPVDNVLAKNQGAYHVCYEVRDMELVLEWVRKNRCLLVSSPTPAVAFDQRKIAWIFTPTRQLIEVVEVS